MEAIVDDAPLIDCSERLQRGFARAGARRCGIVERHYAFGGRLVRVRIAGRRLAERLVRPFAHLRTTPAPGATPRLDITLFDEVETGIQAASAPLVSQPPDLDRTAIAASGRFIVQHTRHGLVCFDRRQPLIVGGMAWGTDVGVYQRGKPLARLLAEWYADVGVPIVHAALVARGQDGVLLMGKGGSGKSTLALACARAGLGFLGEDYAALELPADGTAVGHSAYNSVFVTPETCRWFPEIVDHAFPTRQTGEPKSVVLVADVWPSRLRTSVAIRALAVCRIGPASRWSVRPASRAEALLASAPSSLLQIHGRRRDRLDLIARLVERVPCFHLELGADRAAGADSILHILDRVTA